MFQSLRPNSPIYILHKGDNPFFEIGTVTNVTPPRSKYGVTSSFSPPQDLIVDIIIKVKDIPSNYNGIPATAEIADFYNNDESIVISDNKEAINAEVLNLKKKSSDVINSIDLHKHLEAEYDKILQEINPDIAEKQLQRNEISALKTQMSEMNKNMSELMAANRLLMEQLTKQKNENVGNFGKA